MESTDSTTYTLPSAIQRMKRNQNSDTTNISSYSSENSYERKSGKEKADIEFVEKLLEEMENEYPTRHSLWIESPDKNNPKSSSEDSSPKHQEKSLIEVNHELLAHGLKAIQQDLFYKMESSELARYIFKPHTVNEVNSPYLCGYLYFYERMRCLVINELLAHKNTSEMAQVFCYFVEVAYFCFHLKDKQSTSAILSGLCNLAILKHEDLWSTLFENNPNKIRILSQILQNIWKEKKNKSIKSQIPFFTTIVELLVEELPQKLIPRPHKCLGFSEFVKGWYQWRRQIKKPETVMGQMKNALSQFLAKHIRKKNTQTLLDYTSDDQFTTHYREMTEILNFIEDFRNNYSFATDPLPLDRNVKYFLLSKKIQKLL